MSLCLPSRYSLKKEYRGGNWRLINCQQLRSTTHSSHCCSCLTSIDSPSTISTRHYEQTPSHPAFTATPLPPFSPSFDFWTMTINASHRAATAPLTFSPTQSLVTAFYNSSTIIPCGAALTHAFTHSRHCPHQLGPSVGTIFVYIPVLLLVEEGSR
jgi:hypothetical protein